MIGSRTPALIEQLSGSYLQSVIDAFEDELLVIDRKHCIVQANAVVWKRRGKQKEDIIGQTCFEVSHGLPELCRPPRHECPINTVWETGKSNRVTHLHVYDIDGVQQQRYLDIIGTPLFDKNGKVSYVVELMRDVTEWQDMELKVAEAHKNLLALNSIANVVSQTLDVDTVLTNALDKTMEMLKADIGGILLWDEDQKRYRYRADIGLSKTYVKKMFCKLGEGIAGRVAQTGKPILTDDIGADPRTAHRDLIIDEGLKGFASVPLAIKDKIIGILNVASKGTQRFSANDLDILGSIAAQVAIGIENARLHQEVQHQDQVRGELLSQVFSIQEEERKRIARELHDETMQSLTALAASVEVINTGLSAKDKDLQTKLKSIQNLALKILDDTHKLIYELRPTMLDDLGLVSAVRAFAKQEFKHAQVTLSFKVEGKEKRLSTRLESTLFRVVQEAINNITRHAHARKCEIVLIFKRHSVGVRISDDGRGFDVNEAISAKERPRGLGLLGMRERIELVHGTLEIQSVFKKGGTTIDIEIPTVRDEGNKNG